MIRVSDTNLLSLVVFNFLRKILNERNRGPVANNKTNRVILIVGFAENPAHSVAFGYQNNGKGQH